MTRLVYVYAVLDHPVPTEQPGIDGAAVRWIAEGALAAAVSDVPATDFDEAPLNQRIRDLAWLAPRAEAHQAVTAQLAEQADACLPLAFGTVFRSDDRVRELLQRRHAQLERQLEAVRGKSEWVVALHRVGAPDVRRQPAVRALQQQIAASSPGRAHLLKRRLAEVERDAARQLEAEAVQALRQALQATAAAVYDEPLPQDTVERPLLRASALVARPAEETFIEAVERVRQQWPEPVFRLQLTGPWPPYRFGGVSAEGGSA